MSMTYAISSEDVQTPIFQNVPSLRVADLMRTPRPQLLPDLELAIEIELPVLKVRQTPAGDQTQHTLSLLLHPASTRCPHIHLGPRCSRTSKSPRAPAVSQVHIETATSPPRTTTSESS